MKYIEIFSFVVTATLYVCAYYVRVSCLIFLI